MFDATRYQMDNLKLYPAEQWRIAIAKFPPPSNRPPHGFWKQQRHDSIKFLIDNGVPVEEKQGKVYIGDILVDGQYIS